MSKFLSGAAFAFAAAAALSGPTRAAENPPATWTGFYVGANAGYGWGRSKTTETFSNADTSPAPLGSPGALLAAGTSTLKMNDVIGGFQAGFNWQTGSIVFGVEADIQRSNQKAGASFACAVPQIGQGCNELLAAANQGLPPTATFNQHLDWFGTLRGRLGLLVTPDTLVYASGGFARGRVETDGAVTGYGNGTVQTTSFSHRSTQSGWTAGVGIESRVVGNWITRIEYLHIDLGNLGGEVIADNFPPLNFSFNSRITDDILRVGLSYKFGDMGPPR